MRLSLSHVFKGTALVAASLFLGCAPLESNDRVKCTPDGMLQAAKNGDIESLRMILSKDPDLIKIRDKEGRTPLHLATGCVFMWAGGLYPESLELLLESGADVNARDNNGYTALHHAAGLEDWTKEGRVTVSDQRGSKPSLAQKPGVVAVAMMRVLLAHGADVNAKAAEICNVTPLHFAARQGLEESVQFLLENGGDIKAKMTDGCRGYTGFTPVDVARHLGRGDIVRLLSIPENERR